MTLARSQLTLCGVNRCRLPSKHDGNHDPYPTKAWSFMRPNDKKKLASQLLAGALRALIRIMWFVATR
jgi:hypothetical protein